MIPDDPIEQVFHAVSAVFRSWNSGKAREYRKMQQISEEMGTAVNVQMMVFGNAQPSSGTAVLFSSCPKTGRAGLQGEFLFAQQGESIVSGKVTPENISVLEERQPDLYSQLERLATR